MAENGRVYAVCENKSFEETLTKQQIEDGYSPADVGNNLDNHINDAEKHLTESEKAKLAKVYTTDDIIVSNAQPAAINGRIWIKI